MPKIIWNGELESASLYDYVIDIVPPPCRKCGCGEVDFDGSYYYFCEVEDCQELKKEWIRPSSLVKETEK